MDGLGRHIQEAGGDALVSTGAFERTLHQVLARPGQEGLQAEPFRGFRQPGVEILAHGNRIDEQVLSVDYLRPGV